MAGAPDAAEEVNPLDKQRELMDLLSQETRHQIIQTILGHPEHLPSADELDYIIADKTKKSITDQLDRLQEEGIIEEYTYDPNRSTRGFPWKFFGLTEYGIQVLGEFNYLRGVPMARAIIQRTRTTEKIERHMDAPRPSLPPTVKEALRLEEDHSSGSKESSDRTQTPRDEPPTIFISYAYADNERAKKLIDGLRERGYEIWIGDENVQIGDDIVSELRKNINEADAFISLISDNSVNSSWMQAELSEAITKKQLDSEFSILPVLLDDCNIPESISNITHADARESVDTAVEAISDVIDETTKGYQPKDVRVQMSQKSAAV